MIFSSVAKQTNNTLTNIAAHLFNTSSSSSLKTLLSHCLGLTVASSSGVMIERRRGIIGENEFSDHLHTVKSGVATFASVDVSSPNGIVRARDLDLVGSGISEALVTPLLYRAAADLFSAEIGRRARIFSVMRHPVERAVSLFYYLQNATWERTYDPTLQNMTLEEYATSKKAESNWMVRMLNNEPATVDDRHLHIAKRILQEKVLIGLTSQMEESVRRFYSYFGWSGPGDRWSQCERRLLFGGANTNDHHSLKEGAMAWDLLSSRNSLDVALYDYAVELFHRQGAILFESNSLSPADSFVPRLTRNSDVVDDEIHQLLDMNASRHLESNVADGDIVPFRASSLSCSEIIDSNACAGHQNCVWKESSKICESNIFGHSSKMASTRNARKGCIHYKSQRQTLRCLKRKKRSCRIIENIHKKMKCRNKQTKKIQKIRKALNSRALSQNTSIQSRPLHILSLGGSVTWGSQLDDRSLAYPAVLSSLLPGASVATNIAMRATGSDYASMCIQSMVAEGHAGPTLSFDNNEDSIEYDIITIEYSLNGIQALPRLLRRLRGRYPDAFIIYINLYSWERSVADITSNKTIYEIKSTENGPREGVRWVEERVESDLLQLVWTSQSLSSRKFVTLQRSMHHVGGVLYTWPLPRNPLDDLPWFAADLHHLNALGHRKLAEDLSKMITSDLPIFASSNQKSNGWGTNNEDHCTSWYHSGISNSVEMSKAIRLFSPGKYAIETTKSYPVTIRVSNPYNRTMPVGIGVMSHKEIYPKAFVSIQVETKSVTNLGDMNQTILDPINRNRDARASHVVQTHFIGLAGPGQNTITIKPMQETRQPLRITGIIMCSGCDLMKFSLPGHEGYHTDVKDPPEINKFTTEVPCPWPPRPTLHDTRASFKYAYGRSFEGYIQTMMKRYESSGESELLRSYLFGARYYH